MIDVPKLQDAHWAGTNKSSKCTLVLTEGDSAMALAVAGLEVVGREVLYSTHFCVFYQVRYYCFLSIFSIITFP